MLTQIRRRALDYSVRSLVRFPQREATTGWGRAIAYDQLQPMVVASHNLSAGRPCERRDPSPLAPKVKKGLCSSAETRGRVAAMSAIALTLGSLSSQGRVRPRGRFVGTV